MQTCKCGRLVTHSKYSKVCHSCRRNVVRYNKFTPVSNDKPGINKGKDTYAEYNPSYEPPDFSVSPQNKGKAKFTPKPKTTDKLNKLLRRNI